MSTAVIKKKKKKGGGAAPAACLASHRCQIPGGGGMFPKCLESWPDSADPTSLVEVDGLRPFPRRERRRLPISPFPTHHPSTDPQSASAEGVGSQAVPNGHRRLALATPLSDRSPVDFADYIELKRRETTGIAQNELPKMTKA